MSLPALISNDRVGDSSLNVFVCECMQVHGMIQGNSNKFSIVNFRVINSYEMTYTNQIRT